MAHLAAAMKICNDGSVQTESIVLFPQEDKMSREPTAQSE